MRYTVLAVVFVLASTYAVSFAAAPQPAFDVKVKVEKITADNKMEVEIIDVGKLVRPGMYGSFMREKYKVGDKITVLAIIDKKLKLQKGNILGGTLEKVIDAKGPHNEFSNVSVVAVNMTMYNVKKNFQSETKQLKTKLYGTESNQ